MIFSSRRKGIAPNQMNSRGFRTGVTAKINSALTNSGNSRSMARLKSGSIIAVITASMVDQTNQRQVAEADGVKAGLQVLVSHDVITQKDYDSVYEAINEELYN